MRCIVSQKFYELEILETLLILCKSIHFKMTRGFDLIRNQSYLKLRVHYLQNQSLNSFLSESNVVMKICSLQLKLKFMVDGQQNNLIETVPTNVRL